MRVRIRGHYRIDANGRVVPVVEKRDSVLPYAVLPDMEFTARGNHWNLNLVELCVVLVVIGTLICSTLVIIPRVRRAVAAAQAASARALIIQQHAGHSATTQAP